MLRRTFVSAALLGAGGAGGYIAGLGLLAKPAQPQTPEQFKESMKGVRLDFVSRDLLLKLYTRTVGEGDRLQLVREVVNHNWPLFIVKVPNRRFGEPGLYRLVE